MKMNKSDRLAMRCLARMQYIFPQERLCDIWRRLYPSIDYSLFRYYFIKFGMWIPKSRAKIETPQCVKDRIRKKIIEAQDTIWKESDPIKGKEVN